MVTERPPTPFEVDEDRSADLDSATQATISTSSKDAKTANSNEAYDFKFEGGRRYHANEYEMYMLPNDDREQDRLNFQHHIFRLTIDGPLYLAPLPPTIKNVLDIGCGTGLWAIEFAKEFPNAQVLGVDLSPVQPKDVPANCHFQVGNLEMDWNFEEKFDVIHSRAMIMGIKDWPKLLAKCFQNLNPGGYIEFQDGWFPARCLDPTLEESSKFVQYNSMLVDAAKLLGSDLAAPASWKSQIVDAGFVNIHMKWANWPVGTWAKGKKAKILGKFTAINFENGLSATPTLITKAFGKDENEVKTLLADAMKEMKEQKIYLYQPVCFAYAQRPE